MKQQILIVEDNEINRETLKAMLSDMYRILEAENGQEALEILQSNKENIALILLDVMMPVMDGYTFLDIVKKDAVLSLIPVIVTTQSDSEADEIAALEHGANDFVTKPYRPQLIRHRAASIINLRENAAMVNQFMYDRLTGLYSKDFFYRKVRECLAAYPDREYTLLCCNIENFRLYNDTFGRRAGDKLLKEAARIFRKRVSEDAVCCRYNADRFLALTDKASEAKGRESFAKARQTTRSELSDNLPVKLGIYEIKDRSIPVELMCDRAVWVVDTIKGIYDRYIAVYDDNIRNILLREQAITDTMETALAEKQFTVYFQPKHSLNDDRMVGAEALVRWIHPEWGFMSPGEFIPLFERNGFIRRLDEYVWETVCEKLHEWTENGYSAVPVSVNVSRADIYQSDLVEHFCALIEKYRIDPSLLHLEITESAYTDNPEQIISTVEELRNKGFIIEMDDFGSGYSSLNMLGEMSLDILKLDMKFIRNQMSKPAERSLLQAIINMAHTLKLKVVAEGVETIDQKERLKSMACDIAQGYFYAKPTPAAEYEKLLQR
ncbi:MAG: EAL domain-containing protein [Oscillospiraceae bacterium]